MIHYNAIPMELRLIARWGVGRIAVDEKGRATKPPKFPTTKLSKWRAFEAAQALVTDEWPLFGFCTTELEDLLVLDFDHCIRADGSIEPGVLRILRELPPTYMELSPSQTGIRAPYRRTGKGWDARRRPLGGEASVDVFGGESPAWITFTGYALSEHEELQGLWQPDLGALDEIDDLWLRRAVNAKEKTKADVDASKGIPPVGAIEASRFKGCPDDIRALLLDDAAEIEQGRRSDELNRVAGCLLGMGLAREEVFSAMASSTACMAAAESKWGTRALAALWRWYANNSATKAWQGVGDPLAEFEDLDRAEELERGRRFRENLRELCEEDIPRSPKVPLTEALRRFVLVEATYGVYDMDHPRHLLKWPAFVAAYAPSKVWHPKPTADNPGRMLLQPMSSVWLESAERRRVKTVTFKAGDGPLTTDPLGVQAVNTWRPFDRNPPGVAAGSVQLFLDHISYLFGDRAEDFLSWLAHIEQAPGVLPHTCWLHVSPRTGTGRNWLASVLAAVWRGRVASDLEINAVLNATFNDELSEALLAVVNECREATGLGPWANAERFKAMVNAQYRQINKKYGMKYVEHNCCRWLLFSNHLTAIPMESDDRRIEVVVFDGAPKDEGYYIRLYGLLTDPGFILGVAQFLAARDLTGWNPGRRALYSGAKARAVEAAKNPLTQSIEDLLDEWPSDVVPNHIVREFLGSDLRRGETAALMRHGCEAYGSSKITLADGSKHRCWILRNANFWREKLVHELSLEAQKGLDEWAKLDI